MRLWRNSNGSGRYGASGIARTMAYALGAVVLVACAGEAVLRFGLGLGNPVLVQSDAACGYILKPDQDVYRFFAHTHTNRYGMRSDEVGAHQAGTLRLLFVGDSITYGTSRVDQREIFTEILHRDLPAIVNRPVEVLNASAGAWAPANELSYLRSRGTFDADIVLLVLNDGDLTQPRATLGMVGDDLPQKRPATAIGELFTRYLRPRMTYWMKRKDAGDSVDSNAGQVTRDNLADLDGIEELATQKGAWLAVIFIPFRKDIGAKSYEAEGVIRGWAASHNAALFDLTAAESPYSAAEITLDNGIHFNGKGNRILAQSIEQNWNQVLGSYSPGVRPVASIAAH